MVTIVATDGSAIRYKKSKTGFQCAAGFVAETYSKKKLVKTRSEIRFLGDATNNIAEFTAFIMGLEAVVEEKDSSHVIFIADSQYMIDCVTKWFYSWKRQVDTGAVRFPKTANGTSVKNFGLITKAHNLFYSFPNAKLLKIRSHINPNKFDVAYNEFLKRNQFECSYELWTKFRELNEKCDAMVQKCSTTTKGEEFTCVEND